MKFWSLAWFIWVTMNLSCSDSPTQVGKVGENIGNEKTPKKKPAGGYSDTIVVRVPSAVFYKPDSLQWEKIKAITDTMIFESTVHDCEYQMRNARYSLPKNWPGIKMVEVSNARWIQFQLLNGTSDYIDLDKLDDPCGILLFDGQKKTRLADMMNIDTELGLYFAR
jgi:hypothetical protein